ncbi:hypothetical protein Y032_0016g2923 [Ancylostoma ceylanicum]|uniref:Uncharacterized protein n=1 Tax=Ancylostoma ceylanicum TaxID=53326 RepID=A0A016V7N9_9BILA|nr:hypothetical protein Y032_0016g2923 [Ancylostoma ceylanicum]
MLSTDLFTLLCFVDLIVHGNSQYGKSLQCYEAVRLRENHCVLGQLWCQQGSHKLYSPTQCPAQTLECFKFTCDAEEAEFVARGCGVSLLTTAAGLPNESCHQAISICEHVGGIGSCFTCNDQHMCNTATSFSLLTVLLLVVLVRI